MLIYAFLLGFLLALTVHLALRISFLPKMRKKWSKPVLKECTTALLNSKAFEEKALGLFKEQIQNTFNRVKAQIPFASSLLTSDFAKKLEQDTENALLGVVPVLKDSLSDDLDALVDINKVKLPTSLLWGATLAAFLLGFVLSLAAKGLLYLLAS